MQQTEALVVVLVEVGGLDQVPPVVGNPLMRIPAKGMMEEGDVEVDLDLRPPLEDRHTIIITVLREGAK
jgi:hypothetical protein